MIRPVNHELLRKMLPYGYIKEVQKVLPTEVSDRVISQTLCEVIKHNDVDEALAWVALSNLMDKIFAL